MAKNKKHVKNFKLEQEELKPLTIGIFESRKKSSIGIFIVLTLFVVTIFFLPQISAFINSYIDPESEASNPGHTVEPITPPDAGEQDEIVFYDLTQNPVITTEDITVDSLQVNLVDNTFSYKIVANSNTTNLNSLNYYFELYNEEQTLLERVKLIGNDGAVISGTTLTKDLDSEVIGSVKLVTLAKVEESDYPAIQINTSEDGIGTLVCTKNYETVTYKFQDDKLKELTSEIAYPSIEIDYLEKYNSYRTLASTYNSRSGIVLLFSGSDVSETFNITTNVDLSEATRTYIFNADTFNLDTEARIVDFEMEAQGFKCN